MRADDQPADGFSGEALPEAELRERIKLPPGFSIGTYASGVDGRALPAASPTAGDLLVSSPRQGKVFLLERDADGDGARRRRASCSSDLDQPHGLALPRRLALRRRDRRRCCACASIRRRGTVSGDAASASSRGLPDGGNHWTRTVHVGPDGKLYVSIGSSCNVCIEDDQRRAAIMRFDLDGSGEEIYATGLRNSVDFAWQPGTGALYATDNGRDLLGDDFPPCELNRIVPRRLLRLAVRQRRPRARSRLRRRPRGARSPRRSRPRTASARTSRRSASRSTTAAGNAPATFPARAIAARRSSRSTARGTARRRAATRSSRCIFDADGTITRGAVRDRLHDRRAACRPAGRRRRRPRRRALRLGRLHRLDLPHRLWRGRRHQQRRRRRMRPTTPIRSPASTPRDRSRHARAAQRCGTPTAAPPATSPSRRRRTPIARSRRSRSKYTIDSLVAFLHTPHAADAGVPAQRRAAARSGRVPADDLPLRGVPSPACGGRLDGGRRHLGAYSRAITDSRRTR